MKKLKIGDIELKNNIILAPMAGITDLPLRFLAKHQGAGLVYTEMASAKALVCRDEKTKRLLDIADSQRPVAAQIFGADPCIMAEAAKIVRDMGADIIDINLGCPARKIAKSGAGAELLSNQRLVHKILETVVKSVAIAVTIKIRIGVLPGQNIAPEIIKIAQNSGIKMVAIHARYAYAGHGGNPDLQSFADACFGAKIPIVANGGIVDEKTAANFFNIPNCSGIMIGRGAIGNYSIFKRLEKFLNYGEMLPAASKKEKIEWLKQHAQYSIGHYGQKKGLVLMRKVAHYYVKDFLNATRVRCMINTMATPADFNDMINTIECIH